MAEWVALARRVTVRELLEAARAARRASSDRPLATEEQREGGAAGQFVPTGAVEEEDSDEILSEVRLELPVPVDVAVDETRDLHRAVGGRESNLASFVEEALVGEAFAGPHPPDAEVVPVGNGESRAARKKLLAQVNAGWQGLDGGAPPGGTPGETSTALESEIEPVLEQVVALEGAVAWGVVSAAVAGWQLRDLVEIEDRLEQLLGRALHPMSRHGDWSQLGFAGVGHYAEQR